MDRIKLLIHIVKVTKFTRFVTSFVTFMLMAAFVFMLVEPEITGYFDALWFSFVTSTTVGYGDFVPVTLIGRLTSVVLTIYGLIFFGALTAVIINYYSKLSQEEKE